MNKYVVTNTQSWEQKTAKSFKNHIMVSDPFWEVGLNFVDCSGDLMKITYIVNTYGREWSRDKRTATIDWLVYSELRYKTWGNCSQALKNQFRVLADPPSRWIDEFGEDVLRHLFHHLRMVASVCSAIEFENYKDYPGDFFSHNHDHDEWELIADYFEKNNGWHNNDNYLTHEKRTGHGSVFGSMSIVD